MKYITRRKNDKKILDRIEKMASMGDEGRFNYFILVDDFIKTGKWAEFLDILERFYDFRVSGYEYANSIKLPSWRAILFKRSLETDKVVDDLMSEFGIFRVGIDYYKVDGDNLQFPIGSISEEDYLVKDRIELLQTNSDFQKRMGNKRVRLIVTNRMGIITQFNDWNEELSFARNYRELYKLALTSINL